MIGETTFQASARAADGSVSLKVTAFCGYGSRTASVSAEVTDEKLLAQLEKVFENAVKSVREDLQMQAVKAAAESLVIATNKKETL